MIPSLLASLLLCFRPDSAQFQGDERVQGRGLRLRQFPESTSGQWLRGETLLQTLDGPAPLQSVWRVEVPLRRCHGLRS